MKKTLHSLVVLYESTQELDEEALSAINAVLSSYANAERVVCVQMDTTDIARSICRNVTDLNSYSTQLNDAIRIVKEAFPNRKNLERRPLLLATAFLQEESGVSDAFKTISNYCIEDVKKCPNYKNSGFSKELVDIIKKIVIQFS